MVDPREAQDNYERACEAHHEACEAHLAVALVCGRDYADEHCPVPPSPAPPCDGSYTDPWESVEALHGPVYGSNPDYSFEEHCNEMGLPSGERNAYLQRLEDRHARAAGFCG